MDIDAIDRTILDVLMAHGRVTWLALADAVGLSPSSATDRVRRLERAGVITGYHARIAPAALGRPLEAWVAVTLQPGHSAGFIAALQDEPAVIDAVHLTGPADYELRVRCRDTDELDGLLTTFKADHGVASSHTRIVLNRVAGPRVVQTGDTPT